MFSESELAFLAFVFIVTLGCFVLERRRTDSPPVRRPNKKKRKRVKCYHCSLSGQNKNKRPPEENDDHETHNSRGTLFMRLGYLKLLDGVDLIIIFLFAVIELLTSFSFTKFYLFLLLSY